MESVSSLFCPELSITDKVICQDVPDAGAISNQTRTENRYKIPIFKAKKYTLSKEPKQTSAQTKNAKSLSQASRISSIRHIPMNILLNNTLSSVQTINLTTSYPCSPYLIVMMYNKHQVTEYTDEYARKKAKYLWLRSKLDEINQIKTPIHKPRVINNKKQVQVEDKELGLVTAALERLRTQVTSAKITTKAITEIRKRRTKKRGWPKGVPRGPRHIPVIISNK